MNSSETATRRNARLLRMKDIATVRRIHFWKRSRNPNSEAMSEFHSRVVIGRQPADAGKKSRASFSKLSIFSRPCGYHIPDKGPTYSYGKKQEYQSRISSSQTSCSCYGRCTYGTALHYPRIPTDQPHIDLSSVSRQNDETDGLDTLGCSLPFGLLPTLTDDHKGLRPGITCSFGDNDICYAI